MADGILLSRNLIYQLVDDEKPKKTKRKIPKESQKKVHQKQTSDKFEIPRENPSPGWPLQSPLYLPPPPSNPELETVRSVLKESENVLEKLKTQEETMLEKVTERAKELHDKEFKLPQKKTIICEVEKDACLECYKDHTKDPLKCSPLVTTFRDCVRRARKQYAS